MKDKSKPPKIDPALVDRGRIVESSPQSDDYFKPKHFPELHLFDDPEKESTMSKFGGWTTPAKPYADTRKARASGGPNVDKTAARSDLFSIVDDAMRLKKVMLKKGLTRAKAKCPKCGGWLRGDIHPRNHHIHVRCDGPCGRSLME